MLHILKGTQNLKAQMTVNLPISMILRRKGLCV